MMDQLIREFDELSIPSRTTNIPDKFTKISKENIAFLLDNLLKRNIPSARKQLQFRKLRELATVNGVSGQLLSRIYEESARYSIIGKDFSEFLLAAGKLTMEIGETKCQWVWDSLLLYYATISINPGGTTWSNEEYTKIFYKMFNNDMDSKGRAIEYAELVWCIINGNLPRYKKLILNFSLEPVFKDYLKDVVMNVYKNNLAKSCKDDFASIFIN